MYHHVHTLYSVQYIFWNICIIMYIHCTVYSTSSLKIYLTPRWYRIQVAHLIVRSHIQTFINILCQIFFISWLIVYLCLWYELYQIWSILEKSRNYLTWTSSSCVEIVSILPNNVLSSELNSRSSSRTSENRDANRFRTWTVHDYKKEILVVISVIKSEIWLF